MPLTALTLVNIGSAFSLAIIAGGLLFFLWRSIKGLEIDRRSIFVFIFIAVSAPILFPITFHEEITPTVRAVFEKVEALPVGSPVMITFDFDPAMAPEVQPMANAFARHCLAKGHKVVFMALWATGQSLLTTTLENVVKREFPNKKEGADWVNLGYKAGNQGVLNVIVTDFRKMFPTDVNSISLDSIPVMQGIKSCRDLKLILSVGGGFPGCKEWVLFVGDPAHVPIGGGVAAVSAPQLYPYYPKQLLGILGGIKGAAEYESHLATVYPEFEATDQPGIRMMGPQTLAHMVIMMFIIIGNVAWFRSRRMKGKA